ncbi:MAG: hypothetical protein NUV96_02995 [Candidatus Colwellbacteria bacterium]|nr:hypothetical protein [Candidatus Colwellbacteria bacterium]
MVSLELELTEMVLRCTAFRVNADDEMEAATKALAVDSFTRPFRVRVWEELHGGTMVYRASYQGGNPLTLIPAKQVDAISDDAESSKREVFRDLFLDHFFGKYDA